MKFSGDSVWVRGRAAGEWESVWDSDKMLQTSRRVRENAGEGLLLVNTRSSCFPALCGGESADRKKHNMILEHTGGLSSSCNFSRNAPALMHGARDDHSMK